MQNAIQQDDPTLLWAWDDQNNRFMQPGLVYTQPWKPVQLTPEQQADPRYQYDPNRHQLYRNIVEEQQYYARDWRRREQEDQLIEELIVRANRLMAQAKYPEAMALRDRIYKLINDRGDVDQFDIWREGAKAINPNENVGGENYNDNFVKPIQYSELGKIVKERLNAPSMIMMPEEKERVLGNPLWEMELKPPLGSARKAATFGKTRNGETKWHRGIDLRGAVGTPVIAAHDGKISSIIDMQPNRINGNYPQGYPSSVSDDTNDAGNRIVVDIDGQNLQDVYWHLQAGNAVAINPRTGEPFKKDDPVYMGDVIGYVGITGNPNPKVPHKHYGIRTKDTKTYVNPFDYINASYDEKTEQITSPKLRFE